MILLLEKVSVLLLTALTAYAASSSDSLSWLENWPFNLAGQCAFELQNQTLCNTSGNVQTVECLLKIIMNFTTCVMNDSSAQNNPIITSFGKAVLDENKKLISTLAYKTKYINWTTVSVQNLDVLVVVFGPKPDQYLYDFGPAFSVSVNVSIKINHVDLPKTASDSRSSAMAIMSYANVADVLKPSFFSSVTNADKTTVMSCVVSATSPNTTKTGLTNPASFTLTHITQLDPEAFLFCMDWETNTWATCFLVKTWETSSVCSCNHLTTFALISQTNPCMVNLTELCVMDFLNRTQYNIPHHLRQKTVERYLTTIMNLTTDVMTQLKQRSYGNLLMNVIEKLASKLVKDLYEERCTHNSTNITLPSLEIQVFVVRQYGINLTKTPTLITSNAAMDMDLIGISKNNYGSAAVVFISYTNIAGILDHSFETFTNTNITVMSVVVSAILPKTYNTTLTEPANFTLKHIQVLVPEYILSCMYLEKDTWKNNICNITQTNTSHTVCSCDRVGSIMLIMQTDPCIGYLSGPCAKNFLHQIPVNIPEKLPQEIVENYLKIIMTLTTHVIASVRDQNYLIQYADIVLKVSETLVATLVTTSDNSSNISLSLMNLDVEILMVGSDPLISQILQFSTGNASMDIDLLDISKNNNTAVAFLSYTNLGNLLKPTFQTNTSTNNTMMSTMVSVSLLKSTNTNLTKAVNITFTHISELDPEGILSCVDWDENTATLQKHICNMLQTNNTHTVCSCVQLSTFALIMQTDPCRSDRVMIMLIAVALIVGLIFLLLSILTFSFYSRNPVTNAALINLCINLLLFHLLSLIRTLFLAHIHPLELRAALAGLQWFFLMSIFVWMFIEAVLLYIFMKNLLETRSNPGEVLSWPWLTVVGYLIPLGVLGMSGVCFPKDYIDEECWLTPDGLSIFTFAGPLLFTITVNFMPYLIINIIMIFIYKNINNEIIRMSHTSEKNLIRCLMFRSLSQFVILVCYWILLYIPSSNGVLYNTFQLLNSQQGTFIFFVHCLLNQEVRQKYRKVMCALYFSDNPLATSTSVRTQSEGSQDN